MLNDVSKKMFRMDRDEIIFYFDKYWRIIDEYEIKLSN